MLLFAAMLAIGGYWTVRTTIVSTIARRHQSLRDVLFVPVVIALGIGLVATNTLMFPRLWLSDRALRGSGARLSAWHPKAYGESTRVGLFFVREYSQFGDEMRFLTSECGLVDQCGFVYSPGGRPPNRGEDSFSHLYGDWWHWHQSW